MRQAYIEGAVADLGFQRLRMESGKDTDVTPGDVVKTFCDESTLEQARQRTQKSLRFLRRPISGRIAVLYLDI